MSLKNRNQDILFYAIVVQFILIGFLIFQIYQLNTKLNITNALLSRTFAIENASVKDVHLNVNEHDIVIGNIEAPIPVFIYTSYGCSFCSEFFMKDFPELNKSFIETGIVKLVVRFMISGNDPKKTLAASLALASNKADRFQSYNEMMLVQYKNLDSVQMIIKTEEILQGNENLLASSKLYKEQLTLDYNEAKFIGVKGTPSFVIDGKLYTGYKNFNELQKIIEKLCEEKFQNCED
mgnify:CR=1 FL=1